MNNKEELKIIVTDILTTNEKHLKIPQIVFDIVNDINLTIISCDTVCLDADDIVAKIYTIKNLLQVIDRNKWEWEYYTLKNIITILEKM